MPDNKKKKRDINQVEFDVFVALWNRQQNMGTPKIHVKIARWLERHYKAGDHYLLLMAFRACGKSTLVGLFCAWLLYHNPNLRIMVLAADLPLARKMVRNVKKIIERHPLTKALKPGRPDQWGTDMFTINRSQEMRDPSMLARSVSANMTGSRADFIICDDVEVPNTCDSAEKRKQLRETLAELEYIVVRGGSLLYVGTPHHYFSIYASAPRKEIGETRPFLYGFERLVLPLINARGESQWPEKFPMSEIDAIRTRTGPNKFASQMMLEPISMNQGRLNPDDLRPYDDELEYQENNGEASLMIAGKKIISASCWWDPSFKAGDMTQNRSGDGSVVACVFTDEDGHYYVHDVSYLTYDSQDQTDEANQQCNQVLSIASRYFMPAVHVECNGVGRFLPSLLKRVFTQHKKAISVIEATSRKAKDIRILESFDAIMAARNISVHARVLTTAFIEEMREWRPGLSGHDDGLDAVAGALSCEPIRLKSSFIKREKDWRGFANSFSVPTDFSV